MLVGERQLLVERLFCRSFEPPEQFGDRRVIQRKYSVKRVAQISADDQRLPAEGGRLFWLA
jgi:hypothetical protein